MKKQINIIKISCILMLMLVGSVDAQQNLAQEAYAIFEQSCLICHGKNGSFSDDLLIEYTALIEDGSVVPGDPDASVFYQRLIETNLAKRMPLGQPPLAPAAIETIRQWITVGAPDWNEIPRPETDFITTDTVLQTIENHVNSLPSRDKLFARYFTLTHLYNAGETTEALNAYRRALSKLINSLSWGREVVKPQPIDAEQTIFYIDLRDYEWDVRNDAWTQIEQAYPYKMTFDVPTQTHLREKLTTLQQEMNCEVPFVNIDWFLATASLPPLYHDILALPETDRELEASLEVFVAENLLNAPGKRVWRAGFNNSRVSRHNRVLERHTSRYGAYWKSYDFAGSSESQSILTHPLDFSQDGGEIIFNLPNGLQAYFIVDREGIRIDAAPISIVSNPAVADPTVRTGLSCIGCHTKGMQTFEDEVRAVVEQADNPPFNKERALELYVEKTEMDELVAEDMKRFRTALEKTGGVFGGIEPVQRLHEAFQAPLSAAHAAAAVGLETGTFLEKISNNVSLQNLLGALVLENGVIKRDAWTSAFDDVITALDSPDSVLPPVVERPERIPGAGIYIPDVNLGATIADALGKAVDDVITVEDMATLTTLRASNKDIRDLTGIQYAINLEELWISGNPITDLSPLAGLKNLFGLAAWNMAMEDFSPLAELTNLKWLELFNTPIPDISPLARLTNLERLRLYGTGTENLAPLAGLTSLTLLQIANNETLSNISPLASLINLEWLDLHGCDSLSDISSLAGLTKLEYLNLNHSRRVYDYSLSPLSGLIGLRRLRLAENRISDVSSLAGVISLERLDLPRNEIVDISPLSSLTGLRELYLHANRISDVSSLAGLTNLEWLDLRVNQIVDVSALDGLAARTHISWVENPGAPIGGPKIEGPWLWLPIPEKQLDNRTDLLSEVSGGSVTEHQIATRGATEGKAVGNYEWAAHKISPVGTYGGTTNNMSEMVRAFGLPEEYEWSTEVIVIYGSVILDSPREQKINMFVGSAGRNKVWLNGELIYEQLIRPAEYDYWRDDDDGFNQYFPVTLKQGPNVLLVAVGNGGTITGHFGFEEGTEYTLLPPSEIDIPDSNLRDAIAEALDKESNVPITREEIATLTILRASNRDIRDLTGIESAINLEELWISENPLSDLSPLAGLKNLIGLGAWDNPNISDLSPLVKLPKLRWLDFGRTPVPDLSLLADIKSLRRLTFQNGGIEDLSPLAGLTQLTILDIAYNWKTPDLSPITKLTNLEKFVANNNDISDITPLAALTKLKHLDIHNNLISDVSPLAKLVNLEMVKLYGNLISDISPLESSPIFPYVFWLENPGSARTGPQIEGPWTWLKLPAEHFDTDWLAEASGGTVTEQQVATYGAKDGQHVGDNVWKSAKIDQEQEGRNIFEILSFGEDDRGKHPLIYSAIVLNSPREQKTKILEGSEDASVKIWLNGDLVHKAVRTRSGARLYDRFSPVTLKEGANVLLVAILNLDGRFRLCSVGFDEGTEYTLIPPGAGFTFSATETTTPSVGGTFSLNLNAENITDLAGWQADIAFDPNMLEAVEVTEDDFLKLEGGDTFFQGGTIDNTEGKITNVFSARIAESGVNGSGGLLSVTFKAKAAGKTQVILENFEFSSISGAIIPTVPPNITISVGDYPAWDVNQDGRVSIVDLVLVAKDFGSNAPANLRTDVNRDGVINVQDLILVARHFGESTNSTAASPILATGNAELMPEMVQAWIKQARIEDDGSLAFQQGIENLERLLASLLPEKTALLANYPNPFNPETWIPYHLAKSADVTLTIYAANGVVVRTLALGHQAAGIYHSRSRAVHWDGRNDVGEFVASGVYFYTLTAGDFTATRRMLILK
ncbi:MAG: leucine-rich repeat domain-containing protein [Candidatus Poribacteria bacterium]|nr:leucine-rich repeat domain-containing protein [Candidatus Poribacteria bacterium]